MTARPTLEEIRPDRIDAQHPTDPKRVAAIVEHILQVGCWDLPPVLVLEDEGNGHTILDGHHRCAAAERLLRSGCDIPVSLIPAHVVSIADYCRVVDEHFGGNTPDRLGELDDYIMIDGAPYVRND
jgi:hypothetical protein